MGTVLNVILSMVGGFIIGVSAFNADYSSLPYGIALICMGIFVNIVISRLES